jgi:DNA-binding NarL/FixJ family response regulator
MKQTTLFLVDDYLLTRVSNKRQLSFDSKYKILGDFKNANECFEALEYTIPDIIIMDLDLADINGIEASRIIREKYPRIKIIILTSHEEDIKVLASLSCGACAYIIKGKTDIKKVIDIVASGGFWIDIELGCRAFSKIRVPDVKNLDNLYKYDELKNILTQRELEVLKLLIEGKTNSQIAKEIIVSNNTAKAHVGSILSKLGVKDRVQAAVMAVRANLF